VLEIAAERGWGVDKGPWPPSQFVHEMESTEWHPMAFDPIAQALVLHHKALV